MTIRNALCLRWLATNSLQKCSLAARTCWKSVAPMLSARESFQQSVGKVTATDFDPIFIDDVKNRMNVQWSFEAFVHDMLAGPIAGNFDAAYALDVLEHIDRNRENDFFRDV